MKKVCDILKVPNNRFLYDFHMKSCAVFSLLGVLKLCVIVRADFAYVKYSPVLNNRLVALLVSQDIF